MFMNTLFALSLGVLLASCGSKNVADDYIKSGAGKGSAADATPEDKMPGDTVPDAGEPGDEAGEPAMGDATKGGVFLQDCKSCHYESGLAKTVILDATAVPRLDTAFTGPQKAIHSVYSEAFEQPGRADLEAALKAVP